MTTPGHGLPAWLVDRLENAYQFECEGGPLRNCVEWQQLKALVAACPPQEPDVKDALLEICRRIEAWPSDCVETHRERAAYSGNLIRAVYAIAEQALAALPGAVPAQPEERIVGWALRSDSLHSRAMHYFRDGRSVCPRHWPQGGVTLHPVPKGMACPQCLTAVGGPEEK